MDPVSHAVKLAGSFSEECQTACVVGAHLANFSTEEFGDACRVRFLSLAPGGQLTDVWSRDVAPFQFHVDICSAAFPISRRAVALLSPRS